MKAALIKECPVGGPDVEDERIIERDGVRYWPTGTIIDNQKSFRLVQMGVAKPADEECTLRVGMTSEQMRAAQIKAEMLTHGIIPEDYQRYLDGEILGYDEDGDDVPGPNYIPKADDEDEDEDE